MKLEIPVSGVFTSCATPAASSPIDAIFSEICSCSSRCTRSVMSSSSRIVPAAAIPRMAALQGHGCRVHKELRGRGRRRRRFPRIASAGQRHPVERCAVGVVQPRRPQARRRTARRRHPASRRPIAFGPRHTVEALERPIPPDDSLVHVEHDEPIVERFENVLVELAHPAEFLGLEMQLAVEPAVLDGCGHLSGHRRQQREVFAVERLVVVFPAQGEDGNGAAFEHARDEVVDPVVAPELDFFGEKQRRGNRIVEGHGVSGVEPRDQGGVARQLRRRTAESEIANRRQNRPTVRRPASAPSGRPPSVSTTRATRR